MKLIGKKPNKQSNIFLAYFSKIFLSIHKDNFGTKLNMIFKFLGSSVSSIRSTTIEINFSFCSSTNEIFFSIKSSIIYEIIFNELLCVITP